MWYCRTEGYSWGVNFSGFIFCHNRSRSVIIHDSLTDINMRNTMGAISGARTGTFPEHHLKGNPRINGVYVVPFLVLLTVVRVLVFFSFTIILPLS